MSLRKKKLSYRDDLTVTDGLVSDNARVRTWISREGQDMSSRVARQLVSDILIKGKMSFPDLMEEFEKTTAARDFNQCINHEHEAIER